MKILTVLISGDVLGGKSLRFFSAAGFLATIRGRAS
jgi:hypothetical protein